MTSIEHQGRLFKLMIDLGLLSPVEHYHVLRKYARDDQLSTAYPDRGYFVSYRQSAVKTTDIFKHVNRERIVVDSESRYNIAILLFKLEIIHSFVDARPFGYL